MVKASKAKRPKNPEVENEMVRPPEREGEPPRPATEPARSPKKLAAGRPRPDPEK